MIQWRTQFHQARLIENLTPFNPVFNQSVEQMKSFFDVQMGAFAGNMKLAEQAIYLEMQRQASLLAFNDVFLLEAVIIIALTGIIWIIRKPPIGGKHGLPLH
jgi:DHA2 family multidrug resistance protein